MKDKNFLRDMAGQLNPLNAILGMAKPMLPAIMEKVKAYAKPEAEGGVLQEGEAHCMFCVNPLSEEIRIDVVTFKMEEGRMMVSRFIPLEDFNDFIDGK